MVNNLGQWTAENNYANYPKEKMCFMDEIAHYVQSENYTPKTDIENLCYMIVAHFDNYCEDCEEVIDTMSAEQVVEFVKMSGGPKEFDYYC